jgi:predicted 3-demethylubiquinone-9 3-methyltransferase (glyoxalase superfamily)
MQQITPFLWFDSNAEEAVNFYISIFKNSKVLKVYRYPEGSPAPAGSVMTISFQLNGQDYTALNGGPHVKFNEAISLVVNCDTQAEVDEYWAKLTAAGGQEVQCGWLKDKFGLSWQIWPVGIMKFYESKDREKVQRAFQAMMTMKKLDINAMQKAFDGK